MIIRPALPDDDQLLLAHYREMWRENGVPDNDLEDGWRDRFFRFLEKGRAEFALRSFVIEADKRVVGSASCQKLMSPYPRITRREFGKRGYIWGVYVEPAYRKRGFGNGLTQTCLGHLREIGCDEAVLHTSPFGRSLYERLGFVEGTEMVLDLRG